MLHHHIQRDNHSSPHSYISPVIDAPFSPPALQPSPTSNNRPVISVSSQAEPSSISPSSAIIPHPPTLANLTSCKTSSPFTPLTAIIIRKPSLYNHACIRPPSSPIPRSIPTITFRQTDVVSILKQEQRFSVHRLFTSGLFGTRLHKHHAILCALLTVSALSQQQ